MQEGRRPNGAAVEHCAADREMLNSIPEINWLTSKRVLLFDYVAVVSKLPMLISLHHLRTARVCATHEGTDGRRITFLGVRILF